MRPLEQLDSDVETLLRCLSQLDAVERNMNSLLPTLRAQAYVVTHGGTTVWCDTHEQEVQRCHKAEHTCLGIPLPKVTDPTGDDTTAMLVLADARDARAQMRAVHHATNFLVKLIGRYTADAGPTERDEVERENQPKCERHLRYGYDVPARARSGTRVRRPDGSYVLADPRRLCRWCTDATLTLDRLPLEREIHDNAAGKRLRVPA